MELCDFVAVAVLVESQLLTQALSLRQVAFSPHSWQNGDYCHYSQWFLGLQNLIADVCSRDQPTRKQESIPLTSLLGKLLPKPSPRPKSCPRVLWRFRREVNLRIKIRGTEGFLVLIFLEVVRLVV